MDWRQIDFSSFTIEAMGYLNEEPEHFPVRVINFIIRLLAFWKYETPSALYRLRPESDELAVDALAYRIVALTSECAQLRSRFQDQCRIIEEKRETLQAIKAWADGWKDRFEGEWNGGKADAARDVLGLLKGKGSIGLPPGTVCGGGDWTEEVKPCGCLPSDMCDCEKSVKSREMEDLKESFCTMTEFIKEVARWCAKVHEYDRDQGHKPRTFVDDEEWAIIEHRAGDILDDCGLETEE